MMEGSPAQSAPAETSELKEQACRLPKTVARRAKRPRGTGSIFKPRGAKFFYIEYYPVSGGGFQKTESSGSTLKTVAQEMLRDRLEKIRQGLYCETPPRKVTFDSLANSLLDDYRINYRRSIQDAEGRLENHLRPFFGSYLAPAITTEKAREYLLKRRAEGAADGTIQQEMALLKRTFSLAIRSNKIARAPYIPVPRVDNVRKGFIEREGYIRLHAELPEYLRPFVTMAYTTGMRRGEIVTLKWDNVDLLSGIVRLNVGETKNGEGRVIPLGEELLECLKSQLRLRNNTVPDCPLVFFRIIRTKENPVPSWVPIGDFRKVWETACAKCGLVGLLIHDLRRAAVRNLLRAGVQEQVAMKLSGHLTRAIFARYNIVSEQDLTDAVRKLQRFQEAAEPACPPAQVGPSVSPAQSALVN
jgi:integrase